MTPVLDIAGLHVSLFTRGGVLIAIDGLDLTVNAGETVALVGESGCGKTMTALAVMRLLPDGRDLVGLSDHAMQRVRGERVSMIFQDPVSSLNPVTSVGDQLIEMLRAHTDLSVRAARGRAVELLDMVGIPAPVSRMDEFAHRLSGGTCQRVMIAMAIACAPRLLIADEPTTALDVTIQAQVLALLARLQRESGMATLFITHDLGVVAEVAQRVVVMYAGCKVEEAPLDDLFETPLHPYTKGLLGSTPTPGVGRHRALVEIPGTVPELSERPPGCAFAPRCPEAFERCRVERPGFCHPSAGRLVACFAVERRMGAS
jgi:oligopeptide/dipeptide ABC transporter ATP-binding protein